MSLTKMETTQNADELGEPEEFTWDLFPAVESAKTLHLQANGLPKVGARILPGMIIVGKIGKTKKYDPVHQPTPLEIQGLPFAELTRKYGGMWKDTSLYAGPMTTYIVKDAYFESIPGKQKAVVILEENSLRPTEVSQFDREGEGKLAQPAIPLHETVMDLSARPKQ